MSLPDKIHIIGGPGSGKSFLAKQLSERLRIPHVDLDTLYWRDNFSHRTDPEERQRQLQDIVETDQWVIEGAYCSDWLEPSFEASDLILKLETPALLQKTRLARRLGGRIIRGETNIAKSLSLLRWVDGFEATLDNLPSTHYEKTIPIIGKTGVNACIASFCYDGQTD